MITNSESAEPASAKSPHVTILYWLVLSIAVASLLGYRWRQHAEQLAQEERNKQVIIKTASEWNGLAEAIRSGNVSKVERLLGGTVDKTLESRALHSASWEGQTAIVKLLLDRGVRPIARDLSCAASFNYPEIAEMLLKRGAPVEPKNSGELNPLVTAARGGFTNIVKILIKHGADVNAIVAPNFPGMAYFSASPAGVQERTQKAPLRKSSGPPRPYHIPTALIGAARSGSTETARILLASGADPTVRNDMGKTALDVAEEFGHPEIASLLRRAMRRSGLSPPR